MHFSVMAWGSPPELDARRLDCASAVEAKAPFQEDVARLAVENRKVILPVALVASALSETRSVHAITRIVVITNRCSCPLKGRMERWMQSGNSM